MVCLRGLAEWVHLFDVAGRWLNDEERQRAQLAEEAYPAMYQRLSAYAVTSGRCLCKVIPKHNCVDHMCEDTFTQ